MKSLVIVGMMLCYVTQIPEMVFGSKFNLVILAACWITVFLNQGKANSSNRVSRYNDLLRHLILLWILFMANLVVSDLIEVFRGRSLLSIVSKQLTFLAFLVMLLQEWKTSKKSYILKYSPRIFTGLMLIISILGVFVYTLVYLDLLILMEWAPVPEFFGRKVWHKSGDASDFLFYASPLNISLFITPHEATAQGFGGIGRLSGLSFEPHLFGLVCGCGVFYSLDFRTSAFMKSAILGVFIISIYFGSSLTNILALLMCTVVGFRSLRFTNVKVLKTVIFVMLLTTVFIGSQVSALQVGNFVGTKMGSSSIGHTVEANLNLFKFGSIIGGGLKDSELNYGIISSTLYLLFVYQAAKIILYGINKENNFRNISLAGLFCIISMFKTPKLLIDFPIIMVCLSLSAYSIAWATRGRLEEQRKRLA